MVKQSLNKIFLSASIPYPDRDKKYYNTADIIAIRDAIRALATVVIPHAHLIWGGHPSITPLIRFVSEKMNVNLKGHVTLYQSLFFEDKFPKDNFLFENIVLTPKEFDRDESLILMRNRLITENDFKVGVFIGGMEGVEEEFEMFRHQHSNVLLLPIASTGAAARILFDNLPLPKNSRLLNDYAYMSLFRDLLIDYI